MLPSLSAKSDFEPDTVGSFLATPRSFETHKVCHSNNQSTLPPLPPNRFFYHPDSGWSRDQPQPGSFSQRQREAEEREPGNEVGRNVLIIFYSARVNYVYFCSFLTFVDYLNYPAKSLKNIKETFVLSHSIDPAQSGIKKVRNFHSDIVLTGSLSPSEHC